MLSIEIRGDRYHSPIIVCDHCQQPIEYAKQGNYEWKVGPEGVVEPRIYFTHKRCSRAFEEANAGEGWTWHATELQLLPIYLERNLEIDHERTEEHAWAMAQLDC